ncbi:L-erythro-3,5-diaminohexanoate dehydrogenase (partial) [Micromonospora lupini str. Lupac 08]|uniref:L-erythro-3,5-diaminohexanoate dehydrogenase (Partial) n=1 Tax=Micromonospora lupini str. Lupac 08 TaxID=1150864 RepID=I0L438_9ACTN|nr:L-erythro-3,5-diaminohexanoate dehydrogenase (partial) [Micromonospora lupini str. Lupac 08]
MTSPVGLHRVVQPAGVLPQAAWRLDASAAIAPNEVRIRVQRLNLDAASFRQLSEKHGGDGAAVRAEVLEIISTRGKMQNPVTGVRWDADRHCRGGRSAVPAGAEGRCAGRHAGVADVDAAGDHRRAGPLGRAQRAGALRRVGDPVRAVHRRGAARRRGPAVVPRRAGRVRGARADRPGGVALRPGAGACR